MAFWGRVLKKVEALSGFGCVSCAFAAIGLAIMGNPYWPPVASGSVWCLGAWVLCVASLVSKQKT